MNVQRIIAHHVTVKNTVNQTGVRMRPRRNHVLRVVARTGRIATGSCIAISPRVSHLFRAKRAGLTNWFSNSMPGIALIYGASDCPNAAVLVAVIDTIRQGEEPTPYDSFPTRGCQARVVRRHTGTDSVTDFVACGDYESVPVKWFHTGLVSMWYCVDEGKGTV